MSCTSVGRTLDWKGLSRITKRWQLKSRSGSSSSKIRPSWMHGCSIIEPLLKIRLLVRKPKAATAETMPSYRSPMSAGFFPTPCIPKQSFQQIGSHHPEDLRTGTFCKRDPEASKRLPQARARSADALRTCWSRKPLTRLRWRACGLGCEKPSHVEMLSTNDVRPTTSSFTCECIHTCMHACMQACMHACMHTHMQTYACTLFV